MGVMASESGHVEVRHEVRIEASRDLVFEALLTVDDWWRSRFRSRSTVSLEPWVGGRFMEDWGGESGALYGVVTFIERPTTLVVSRPMGVRGAPASSWTIELGDVAGGRETAVRVLHAVYGSVDAEARRGYAAEWQAALAALKAACVARTDNARAQAASGFAPLYG